MIRTLLIVFAAAALQASPEDPWDFLWREVLEQKNDVFRKDAIEQVARSGPRAARVAARYFERRNDDLRKLIEQLDAEDVAEREAAALALIETGRGAEEALRRALKNGSPEVRGRAEAILERIAARERAGQTGTLLVDLLHILGRAGGREHLKLVVPLLADAKIRPSAFDAAARLATSDDLGLFEDALKDPDEETRFRAVSILADVGGDRARDRLLPLLREDASHRVRRRVEIAFPQDRGPGTILEELVRHPRPEPGVLAALSERLLKAEPEARKAALHRLTTAYAEPAAHLTVDADPEIRAIANARIVAWIQSAWAPLPLAKLALETSDSALRASLKAILYGERGGPWGLMEAAKKRDLELAVAAAVHLKEASPETGAALKALRDELGPGRDRRVLEAAAALCGIEARGEDVLALLDDEDDVAAGLAARAAGKLGLSAAGPRLRELLQGHIGAVNAVAFSPDGRRLLSAGADAAVFVWDVENRRRVRVLAEHATSVTSVAVSPDGKRALSGSADKTLRLWDLDSGARIRVFEGHTEGVTSVAFSPDGRALSAGGDRALLLWDVETGKALRRLEGPVVAAAFDGRRALAVGGPRPVLWDVEEGTKLREFEVDARLLQCAVVLAGSRALVAGTVLDLDTQWPVRAFAGPRAGIRSAALSPDAKLALSGNVDGTAILWDVETGKPLHVLSHGAWVNAAAFAPGGIALTGGQDGALLRWDVARGGRRRPLDSIRLRKAAVEALGALRDARALPELERLARSFPDEAVQALVAIGGSEAVKALLKVAGSPDATARARAQKGLHALPLFHWPEGVPAKDPAAIALRTRIDARREIPKHLAALADGDPRKAREGLENAGYAALHYEIAPEVPEGEEFTEAGAIRVPEKTIARILQGFEAEIAEPILRRSTPQATPDAILTLLDPSVGPRYRAAAVCLRAGRIDILPRLYELLDRDAGPDAPDLLLRAAHQADPKRAEEAVARWANGALDDRKARMIVAMASSFKNRHEVLLKLAQSSDRRLALLAAGHAGVSASRVEARGLWREGKATDPEVLWSLFLHSRDKEDLPVFRHIVKEGPRSARLGAALRLLIVGGAEEVEHTLPCLLDDPWYLAPYLAAHVAEKHAPALERLLESPDLKDKRAVRLLLIKAGRKDLAGDALDAVPQGTPPSRALVLAIEGLTDENLLRKTLALAEAWTDRATHGALWLALVRSPAVLSPEQLEKGAAAADVPEARRAVAERLARAWRPEHVAAGRALLRGARGLEAEDLLGLLSAASPEGAAEAALDAAGRPVPEGVSPGVLGRVLSAGAAKEGFAEKLLELHGEATRRGVFNERVHLVLSAARGTRNEGLVAVLRSYLASDERRLFSRMLAAESLASAQPEHPGLTEEVARMARSARPRDRAAAAHYQAWRGVRLTESEAGRIAPNEASRFLAVEARHFFAARDVLETWSASRTDEARRRSAAAEFALLTSREVDDPRAARDWLLTHWDLPFERAFGRALREAGYDVAETPGEKDLGELVRAARDRRWYLARNAVWMLGVLAADGPRRFESVIEVGSDFRLAATPPPAGEVEAWEKWWRGRKR